MSPHCPLLVAAGPPFLYDEDDNDDGDDDDGDDDDEDDGDGDYYCLSDSLPETNLTSSSSYLYESKHLEGRCGAAVLSVR